ncbi:hypothetical protein M0804_015271 [Polistes exclamans]|nr:hypothetical protein M0804_015271 [Polistes exclamans]
MSTLGTINLKVFGDAVLFHLVLEEMWVQGNGILGDNFYEQTQTTIDYENRYLHFDKSYIPFRESDVVLLAAKQPTKVIINILNPELHEGILVGQEPVHGVYFKRSTIKHNKGRTVIDIFNDTEDAVVISLPTLLILPLEE